MRYIIFITVIVAILSQIACGDLQVGEAVAMKFYEAITKNDTTTALAYYRASNDTMKTPDDIENTIKTVRKQCGKLKHYSIIGWHVDESNEKMRAIYLVVDCVYEKKHWQERLVLYRIKSSDQVFIVDYIVDVTNKSKKKNKKDYY